MARKLPSFDSSRQVTESTAATGQACCSGGGSVSSQPAFRPGDGHILMATFWSHDEKDYFVFEKKNVRLLWG